MKKFFPLLLLSSYAQSQMTEYGSFPCGTTPYDCLSGNHHNIHPPFLRGAGSTQLGGSYKTTLFVPDGQGGYTVASCRTGPYYVMDMVGFSSTNFPLPYSYTRTFDCMLLVIQQVYRFRVDFGYGGESGYTSEYFIPCDPGLIGMSVYHQSFVAFSDGSQFSPPDRLLFTNGLRVVIQK